MGGCCKQSDAHKPATALLHCLAAGEVVQAGTDELLNPMPAPPRQEGLHETVRLSNSLADAES